MSHFLTLALILSYIVMSAFLETETGSRITPADLLLVVLMALAAARTFWVGRATVIETHSSALPLLGVFLLAVPFALHPDRAALELVIVVFGFVGSIAIFNLLLLLPDKWIVGFVQWYVLVMGALSAICIIDFLFMPGLISSRNLGGLQGPFRNTGQAGAFFSVHGAIALSLLLANIVPRNLLQIASVAATLLALVFTLKRASVLAFAVGLLLLLLFMLLSPRRRERKMALNFLLLVAPAAFLGSLVFSWALVSVEGMRDRLEYKFSMDAVDRFSEGFLMENIHATMDAFADSPFFGVGLGNVNGVYMYHEIHSTYLGVLAYGGLLGVAGYVFFMFTQFRVMWKEARFRANNVWGRFLFFLVPLLMGQIVGWAYTYHIRKREFWILLIFVALAVHLSRRDRVRSAAAQVLFTPPGLVNSEGVLPK